MNKKKHFDTASFARLAILSALAMILSFVEGMLPELPVPGARFGLANLCVMTAIDIDGLRGGLCVSLFKAFFATITRGPVAGLMSLCGSVASIFVMWLLIKHDRKIFGYVGVGVFGAVSHNTGQFIVSFIIIGKAVLYYFPFLIVAAVFTGAITGFINSILLPAIKKSVVTNKQTINNNGV